RIGREILPQHRKRESLLTSVLDVLRGAGVTDAEAEARKLLDAAEASGRPAAALDLARRRAAGAPLGLLVGSQRFMELNFLTAPDVLVPREETELLARTALSLLRDPDPDVERRA